MTRKWLIALVSMTLLLCSAAVSAGSSDICPSLNENEDGRYVLLFQKDGFFQYLDQASVEDMGDHVLARILAVQRREAEIDRKTLRDVRIRRKPCLLEI